MKQVATNNNSLYICPDSRTEKSRVVGTNNSIGHQTTYEAMNTVMHKSYPGVGLVTKRSASTISNQLPSLISLPGLFCKIKKKKTGPYPISLSMPGKILPFSMSKFLSCVDPPCHVQYRLQSTQRQGNEPKAPNQ